MAVPAYRRLPLFASERTTPTRGEPARAKDTPPGTWIDGYFFDDTKVKDKRELDASDLDEVSIWKKALPVAEIWKKASFILAPH